MSKANNLFALLGFQEVGLTKSFGFMLACRTKLLRRLLAIAEIRNLSTKSLLKTNVEVEVADRGDRTDVEISSKDTINVIVEGKIGTSLPSIKQLSRYAQRLKTAKGERRLCIITEVEAKDWLMQQLFGSKQDFFGLSKEEVKITTWHKLHESFFPCLDLQDEIDRQFEDYLEEMIMPNEILVESANSDYGSEDVDLFLNCRFFWYTAETMKKRHNYLAMYLGSGFGADQGIQYIARIIKYELCSWEQLGLPRNSKYYKELKAGDDPNQKFYKLVLGEPVRLPWKIGKSRGKMVRHWTTTFDRLLKAKFADELLPPQNKEKNASE
jgi:hypothetical protein